MKRSPRSKPIIPRRDLHKSAAAIGLGLSTNSLSLGKSLTRTVAKNRVIESENAKPGTKNWLLTKTQTVPGKINKILDNGRCEVIEGYCSANSIRAGEKIRIMVITALE